MSMRAAIITLSDAGYAGQREDRSGPVIRELLEAAGYTVVHTALLPDGMEPLASELKRLCDGDLADLTFRELDPAWLEDRLPRFQ